MSTVDFRCEQCGKLLSVEAQPGQVVKCPHCQKKVTVPEGLAALPRPQVPGGAVPIPPPVAGQSVAPEDRQDENVEEPAMSHTMSAMMPWVLSVFLHLGVGLIAGFVGVVAMTQPHHSDAAEVFIPGEEFSETPGGIVDPGDPGESHNKQNVKNTAVTGYSKHDSTIAGDVGNTGTTAALISAGGGGGQAGGGWAPFGVGQGGSGHGPKAAFAGNGGNAHHVIFCIDASGSMAVAASGEGNSPFENVKSKMIVSISHLAEVQDFHIVFFREGKDTDQELPTKRLVPATPEYKAAAVKFMETIVPSEGSQTDASPALKRCFDVLEHADTARKGKMIYLLTDGSFRDNEAILRCIEKNNKAKDVHIYTYLYGESDDESIIKLMKEIASQTGGKYKNLTTE